MSPYIAVDYSDYRHWYENAASALQNRDYAGFVDAIFNDPTSVVPIAALSRNAIYILSRVAAALMSSVGIIATMKIYDYFTHPMGEISRNPNAMLDFMEDLVKQGVPQADAWSIAREWFEGAAPEHVSALIEAALKRAKSFVPKFDADIATYLGTKYGSQVAFDYQRTGQLPEYFSDMDYSAWRSAGKTIATSALLPTAGQEWLDVAQTQFDWDVAHPEPVTVGDTLGTRQDIMSYLESLGYEDVDMLPIVNQVMAGIIDINSIPSDFEDNDLDTGDSLSYYEGLELALSDVFPSAEQFQDLEPDVVYEDIFGKRSRSYERDGDFSSPESGGFDASSEGEGFVPNDSSKKGDFMSYGYRRRSYGRFANVGRRRWSPAFTQGYYAGKRSGRRY